jgi:hypothetical protein
MNPSALSTRLIPLDPAYLERSTEAEVTTAVRDVLKSVKFEILKEEHGLRLLGQDLAYHLADPSLPQALHEFSHGLSPASIADFRVSTRLFDLCFEDCWTGYFIAKRLGAHTPPTDLLFIHLDDHTDMMPTLLIRDGEGLRDPSTGTPFDPSSSSSWDTAIASGAVTIGNFITPLFYSGLKIHVRHINNTNIPPENWHIARDYCQYDLIPNLHFADIRKTTAWSNESVGTYRAGSDPRAILEGAPQTWTLVHIDLDYLINDFNGAGRDNYIPDATLHEQAVQKMDRFFETLTRLCLAVDRWLIATSPGFCAAFHWQWLLNEIGTRIEAFNRLQAASA